MYFFILNIFNKDFCNIFVTKSVIFMCEYEPGLFRHDSEIGKFVDALTVPASF